MTKIIGLGAERKKRARAEKEKTAQNNRVKFGRTGAQKKIADAKNQRAKAFVDAHKITD